MGQFVPKPCCRCRVNPASTPGNAYCKPCRAAYQRDWRARRRSPGPLTERSPEDVPGPPPVRLRGTPTLAEMHRYRLV